MSAVAVVRPPGPRGSRVLGSLRDFRRDPLGFIARTADEFGDVVRYRMGPRTVYLLRHPDHIKEVLVTQQHAFMKGQGLQWAKRFLGEGLLTSEGEFHRRQRRLVQPAFHRQRVASYAAVMIDYAARHRNGWRHGDELDMSREMMALTLAIAAKTLFDADVEDEADEVRAALGHIIGLFHRFSLPFAGVISMLPLPSNYRFRRAKARVDRLIYGMIEERRRAGVDRGDLMSMLLLARDHEGDGGHMTDIQLRDEVTTLLVAGHETTANALTWTWYLLSQHPEEEARLHAELDAVLAGRLPAVEDVPRMPYTEMVLAESMRLFPPAWGLGRRALHDVSVGGYTIPAGSLVVFFPWVTHRDPRFFPDPLVFRPERFTAEARAARPKFAYLPFGGGARQCVGEPFAWLEGVLVLAVLCQAFRARLVPGHVVEPQALITLRPRHGMRMRLEGRG